MTIYDEAAISKAVVRGRTNHSMYQFGVQYQNKASSVELGSRAL
ncbi:hypothetical protein ABIE13_002785 [Ottowia thiooxydans]|uniref:Transposase n=1 Tax=Ottowia thiooxydans TaxID=219182 RepID=A0ABV2Q9I9_9BURK